MRPYQRECPVCHAVIQHPIRGRDPDQALATHMNTMHPK